MDCQRCINLYPEMDEMHTGNEGEVASLIGTPGLSPLQTLGTYACRCLFTASNGVLYACYGNTVYSVTSLWAFTTIGTINSFTGPVSMADNGIVMYLVDGTDGWYSTLGSTSLTQQTSPGWMGADFVTYQDGYFIFNVPGTNQFYVTDLLATTINALNFASKETNPDNIVGILSDNRNLWLFGSQTTEVWYDAGNPTGSPFSIVQGGYIEVGCAAAFSVAKINNMIFFLGQDPRGKGIVYAISGYQPQRVSTHAVELAIQSYGDLSDSTAYCYQENGHNFYVLNVPNANTTWVYDMVTGLWHERVYTNNGIFQRHLGQCHAFAYGAHVIGDYQTGNFYQMSSTYYLDNGKQITRQRISPHIAKDMNRIFYSTFQLEVEPGTGLDGLGWLGTGEGTNPQAMLQFSDDGGHTWSNERWAAIGQIGKTKWRAIWRRLGHARDRVFKLTITDPVKVVLIGAELDLLEGAS